MCRCPREALWRVLNSSSLRMLVQHHARLRRFLSRGLLLPRGAGPAGNGSRRARPGASVHLPVSLLDEPPQVALPLGIPLTLGVGLLCFILKTVYSPMTSAPRRS